MLTPDQVRTRTLPCGLTALVLRQHDAPVVSMQVWYRTGSAQERDGIRGISHLLEHMMFRGSEHFATEEHTRRIAGVGGHCNAFTSEDATAFVNAVPAGHLDLVLHLEADRMHRLRIDPERFATERQVVTEEFHQYVNNPVARAFLEYREEFFKGTQYALSPLGRLDDIARLTVDDCNDYWRSWYTPSNAIVAVVGDIDNEESVFDKIESAFCSDNQKTGVGHSVSASAVQPSATGTMRRRIEFDVPIVLAGYPAPPAGHVDTVSLDIAASVLSHGETARLHRTLVRNRQAAVAAGGMNHVMRSAGMSLFYALHTPDHSTRSVASQLSQMVEDFGRGNIDATEIEKVRAGALTHRSFETCSVESLCQHIAHAAAVEGDYTAWFRRMEILGKLSAEDVAAAANRWWTPEKRFVLELTPRRVNIPAYAMGLLRRFMPQGRGI